LDMSTTGAPGMPRRGQVAIPEADFAVHLGFWCLATMKGGVIAHTIGALQKLDYPADKIEFLMINDGSTDDTAAVKFAALPLTGGVRLLEVPATFEARAENPERWNYALSQARNPLIAIYDADNLPEPGAIRPLAEQMVRQSQAGGRAVGHLIAPGTAKGGALITRFL